MTDNLIVFCWTNKFQFVFWGLGPVNEQVKVTRPSFKEANPKANDNTINNSIWSRNLAWCINLARWLCLVWLLLSQYLAITFSFLLLGGWQVYNILLILLRLRHT